MSCAGSDGRVRTQQRQLCSAVCTVSSLRRTWVNDVRSALTVVAHRAQAHRLSGLTVRQRFEAFTDAVGLAVAVPSPWSWC